MPHPELSVSHFEEDLSPLRDSGAPEDHSTSTATPAATCLPRSWRYHIRPSFRYALAISGVAMAWLVTETLSLHAPYFQTPLFLCSIVLASWVGGFGPGLCATLGSILCLGLFFPQPVEHLGILPSAIPRFAIFLVAGAFISWLGGRQRRDEEALLRAREELEEKVRARTADLRESNEILINEITERVRQRVWAEMRTESVMRANRTIPASLANLDDTKNLDRLLGEVLTIIVEYLQEPEGGLWLYDAKRECLRLHLILEHGAVKPANETDHPGANLPEETAPTIQTPDLLSLFRESGVRTYLPEDIAALGAFAPYRAHLACRGVRSIIAIPFRAADDFLGVISIRSRRENQMATDEVAFVQAIAIHASLALKMSHLAKMERFAVVAEERREAVTRQKEALDRITTAGSATLQRLAEQPEFDVFLDHVLAVCIDQFNATQACVWVGDPATGVCSQFIRFRRGDLRHEVRPAYQYHFEPANPSEAEALRPVRGQIVIHRRADFEGFSTYRHRLEEMRAFNIQTVLRVPLFFGTEARGVLVLKFDSERALSSEEDGLVHALANQVVLALELTKLSEKAKLAALADERNRMAADVHDTLAQAFAATLLHLRSMDLSGTSETLQSHWRYAQATTADGLAAARRTINAIRTEGPADPRALHDRLAERAGQVAARTHPHAQVNFQLGGEPFRLPWTVEDELERLASEALFNAERHAAAREITVTLDYLPGEGARLCVRDDGRGFDEADSPGAGLGLRSMHDRADRVGASFTLITEPGRGTEIVVLWTIAPSGKSFSPQVSP